MPIPADFPPETRSIIRTLEAQQSTYLFRPDEATARTMAEKTFVGLIGPTGVGKSVLTNKILELAPEFEPFGTTTTRPRRPGEDPANYVTADEGVTHQSMRALIEKGELVNYSVNKTGHLYGTAPENIGAYALGPILSDSVEPLMSAGFNEFAAVFVMAEGGIYQQRLEKERVHFGDIKKRLEEAMTSIAFARMNMAENWLSFVNTGTTPQDLFKAADDVIRTARQHTHPIYTHQYIHGMLNGMETAVQNVDRQLG